jgi:hypothetical protein
MHRATNINVYQCWSFPLAADYFARRPLAAAPAAR